MNGQALLDAYFLARSMWWLGAMEQLEREAIDNLLAILKKTRAEIDNSLAHTEWQRMRHEDLAQYCDSLFEAAKAQTGEGILAATANAGAASLVNWNTTLSLGGVAASISSVSLSQSQIKSWFQSTPLGGHSLKEWVEKAFDSGARDALAASMRQSAIEGLGYPQMAKRILRQGLDDGFAITRREAITLARTYTQSANVEAQRAVYEQNSDVVYAVKWTSILDNRVCPRCASLDGRIYRNGEERPPIPLHPRCRCLFLPCVRVGDLGVSSEELEKVARPWVIREPGNIDAGGTRKIRNLGHTTEDFDGWYATLPKHEQARIVGPVRQKLLADGKISFGELVDKETGDLRSLKELGYNERGERLADGPASNAYEIAKAGGKHHGLYKRAQTLTRRELEKSARSYSSRVKEHEGYIANPSSHALNWHNETDMFKRNTIRLWKSHILKSQEERDIILGILKSKFYGDKDE